MATVDWTDAAPLGGDNANTLDTSGQNHRRDFSERAMQGGHIVAALTPPAPALNANNDGKHAVGWETQTDQDDQGYFTGCWDNAGTNPRIRHYGGSHATKADLTEFIGDLGPLSPTTAIKFKGIAYGVWQRILFGDSAPVIGFIHRVLYKAPDPTDAPDRTVTKVRMVVGTRPTGSDLIVKLYKRTTVQQSVLSNDPFDSANCTAFTDSLITLTAGANYAVEKTLSTPETIAPGEEIVAEYTSIGSTTPASDVSISMQLE